MRDISILSLLILLMIFGFGFSEQSLYNCYHKCMRPMAIKRTGRRFQSCFVGVGLKTLDKLMSDAGDLLDLVIHDSPQKCQTYLKQSQSALKAIFRNCHSKCKSGIKTQPKNTTKSKSTSKNKAQPK